MQVQRAFVGRRRELDELVAGLEDAAAGRGRLILLSGEPGIGKSRLADELLRIAEQRGAGAHLGRCWEAGGAPAYWPWIELLRSLLGGRDGEALARLVGTSAVDLLQLLPELREHLPALPPAPRLEPERARFRMFEAVAGVLRRAAAAQPLAVVLDDLHAADPPSLLLLQFVARQLRAIPALVVGAYRDVEAGLTDQVGDALGRVAREARCLRVPPLSVAESAALLGMDHNAAATGMAAMLHRTSEGNPLFLDELARLYSARGVGPAAFGAGTPPIPDGVKQIIGARLARLAPDVARPLEVAAVLGRRFPVALLGALLASAPDVIADRLAAAATAGLISSLGDGTWQFSHILFREVLYAQIPRGRRAELHGAVAAAIAERHHGGADPALAEIAHHLLKAVPAVGVRPAVEAALREAQRAIDALAFEHACSVLERARAALQLQPDVRLECEVLLTLGLALVSAGEEARGRQACLRCAELARDFGDPEVLARAALALGAELKPAIVDRTLVALLEEALAALSHGDSTLRAEVMARLAAASQPAPDPSEPVALARDAIAMARRLGDPATLRAVLHSASAAMTVFADPLERFALDNEAARLAAQSNDRPRELRALLCMYADFVELGDFGEAEAARRHCERLVDEAGQTRARWLPRILAAQRATMEGRFADAHALAEEARALAASSDAVASRCFALHRLCVLRTAERHEELCAHEAASRAALWMGDSHTTQLAGLIAIHARAGNGAVVTELLRGVPTPLPPSAAEPLLATWLAEGVALAGDTSRALALYELLLPLAHRLAGWSLTGANVEGPLTRPLALLAATLGRRDEARRLFEAAIARCSAIGLRPLTARLRWELAEVLLAWNEEGGYARELLGEARRAAEEMGMHGLVARVRGAEDRRVAALPSAAHAAPRLTLSSEGELWTLVMGHRSACLKDSKGLRLLARLVERPGIEIHVLDLEAPDGAGLSPSDAGEVLDEQAIAAYRERLAGLREELGRAEEWNDLDRAARAREEMESLAEELGRGVGLGGRARKAASLSERARVNVQRRLRDAIRRVLQAEPELGRHLEASIRTGTFCRYDPSER